jgi:uncharacterized protein (DUF1015 family)
MPAPGPVPPTPGGLVLAPFRALRYAAGDGPDLATRTAPPYDVIDAAGSAALEAAHPHNVVRLILPRDTGEASPGSRYDRAGETLRDWIAAGILRRDDTPALYVYEEVQDGHVQRGLVGAVALADPDAGIILPHENTMAGPVSDRLALTVSTRANLEPIFLLYAGGDVTRQIVTATVATRPLLTTTTDDGVSHRVWALTDTYDLSAVAADLYGRRAVIADGHHRYATYRHYQADRHRAGDGAGPWDFGLAFLADAQLSGPAVHAIHRVVAGLDVTRAAQQAAPAFSVTRLDGTPDPTGMSLLDALAGAGTDSHTFVITDGRTAFLLSDPDPALLAKALPTDRSSAFRGLDVTVAHLVLIETLWGLSDTEEVVDYRHDAASAIAAAARTGGTALLLSPTPAADVAAVAAAGERMPRKSTLFTPKPRSGLLIRPLDT